MKITGTAHVTCPACGREHDVPLVQSINTTDDPDAKQKLLAGEFDVLDCECGKRTQLIAELLYVDPIANLYLQVAPTPEAMSKGEAAFAAAGATGTQRLVPSINALVEKIKIADAGLEDWVLEMVKVLLLASMADPDLNRILLFDHSEADVMHWVLLPEMSETGFAGIARSTMPARCRARWPPTSAWPRAPRPARSRPSCGSIACGAIAAVQQMMRGGN